MDIGASANPTLEELPASDAGAPEQTEQFEPSPPPRRAGRLTKLNGVGPQLEKKLNEAGIFHYWQLAAMKPENVAKIDAEVKLNGRIARDGRAVSLARAMIEAA